MPAGRPRKEIDRESFEKLCGLQCTEEEIASWFDCTVDTIENWCKREYGRKFSEVFAEKRSYGKISLRRTQWQLAEKNASMAIFLGKNYLGQRDAVDMSVEVGDKNGEIAALNEYFEQRKKGE
jgi:hypothetical protein